MRNPDFDPANPDPCDLLLATGWGDIPGDRIPPEIRSMAERGEYPPHPSTVRLLSKRRGAIPMDDETLEQRRSPRIQRGVRHEYFATHPCLICNQYGVCAHREKAVAKYRRYVKDKREPRCNVLSAE